MQHTSWQRVDKSSWRKDYEAILSNLRNAETLDKVYSDLLDSPVWLEYTLSKSSLYPHQTNAVQETLSAWPMRKLFADEVGLGKTLEVGVMYFVCY